MNYLFGVKVKVFIGIDSHKDITDVRLLKLESIWSINRYNDAIKILKTYNVRQRQHIPAMGIEAMQEMVDGIIIY